ncbi:hypothetical protein ABZZ16_40410, partial [Streptomyces sp. NPDC006386]|uniref:hypothetical protein n=1 Tax=Streptomyces sp. NPDC006386 TaxID=3156762 RepID=UPI00339F31EC
IDGMDVLTDEERAGLLADLRIDVPSSVVRLSTTRLSGCLQKGQCMNSNPPHSRLNSLAGLLRPTKQPQA